MNSFVLQNFYNNTPFVNKTLKYNYIVLYNNTKLVSLYTKFFISFTTKPYMYAYSSPLLYSIFHSKVLVNYFRFYKLFWYRLLGTWTNNLIKSYMYASLKTLNTLNYNLKPKLNNSITVSTKSSHLNTFKILSFNVSSNSSNKNIIVLLMWLTNFNTNVNNNININQTFVIYPQYFNVLHFNDSYYFKVKRF